MVASLALIFAAVLLWRRSLRPVPAAAASLIVFLGLLLWVIYYFVDALTGSGIDMSVLYHLQAGWEGVGIKSFAPLAAVTAMMFVVALVLTAFVYRIVRSRSPAVGRQRRVTAGLGAILGSFLLNPALYDIILLSSFLQRTEASASVVVPDRFAQVENLRFDNPPKNVVILYLESIERAYLDEELFPGLMPNLSALERQALSFTGIEQVDGTNWTISGMVASQCGLPLLGAGANNSMSGMDTFLPGATCIGDLLSAQGYALTYMGGASLDFAGKGNFLRTHGFDTVEGLEELRDRLEDPEYLSDWGLYDDTLYDLAAETFDDLALGDSPFGLVLLTVDTHHPYGYMSRDCGDMVYGDGENRILNAVHCADKMAGAFIRHVIESPAFSETVLVVMSDHLAMPNTAWHILEKGERRDLLFMFGKDIDPAMIDKPASTLDVGATLLNLIGAEVAAFGYGRDILADTPTLVGGDMVLDGLLQEGAAFVSSLWSFPGIAQGIGIDPAAEKAILGGRSVSLPALFLLDADLATTAVQFDFYEDRTLAESVAGLPFDRRFVWIDRCDQVALLTSGTPPENDDFCLVSGMPGSDTLNAKVLLEGTTVGLAELQDSFASEPSREAYDARHREFERLVEFGTAEVIAYPPPTTLVGDFAIRSSGFGQGVSFATNRASGAKVELVRGLTLLGFAADRPPVKLAHLDTCAYGGTVVPDVVGLEGDFATVIAQNRDAYGAFAIVGHDSVLCYGVDTDLAALFDGTDLSRWSELGFEQPYVALIPGQGDPVEYVGAPRTALAIEARDFVDPMPASGDLGARPQRQSRDLPRVAHAGGAYEGMTYTNTLEALDANVAHYDLFEIDLSSTSDGELVCIHDWEDKFEATFGFLPSERPDLATFEDLVRDRGSPRNCTLSSLADWMRRYPDKRIVTDTKEDVVPALRLIAESFPDLLPNFVVQIYQPEEYAPVRALGYDDVIWTLYRYEGSDDDVLAALRRMDLFALAMPVERAREGLASRALAETGVLSLAHTVNTTEEFRSLREAGIAEIYTDFLQAH
ncbi:sulfatase-like hydrolase/transferase [Ostreiculturibacter nitratireducens]|uniref:sulfatase-like hydrolase/transferase n=1 Tax=Ostreiculturibacter nitratireducens TaxID=3075226 RepID=UPI0031B57058